MFTNFISNFLSNIKDFFVIPKFIIYTREKNHENININDSFYNYGGKKSSFNDIFDFIKKDLEIPKYEISSFSDTLRVRSELLRTQGDQEIKVILDPIEDLKQIYLPLYYKTMIKIKDSDNFDKFTKSLYDEYKDVDNIRQLLSQIINLKNMPIELLCKYWLRVYTAKSFHYTMNDYLNKGKTGKYTLFIKLMYEGLRLKVFESPMIDCLYRGTIMSKKEINSIKECLIKKNTNLSKGILFSRAFLSFSLKKEKAIKFAFSNKYYNKDTMGRSLFVLKSNKNINETFNTHADVKNISIYPKEEEILFFPFSCFDLIDIKNIYERDETVLLIELSYLSKYDARLRNKKNMSKSNLNESLIDSEFKKEIEKSHLIDKSELDNYSISKIINTVIKEINEFFWKLTLFLKYSLLFVDFFIKIFTLEKLFFIFTYQKIFGL